MKYIYIYIYTSRENSRNCDSYYPCGWYHCKSDSLNSGIRLWISSNTLSPEYSVGLQSISSPLLCTVEPIIWVVLNFLLFSIFVSASAEMESLVVCLGCFNLSFTVLCNTCIDQVSSPTTFSTRASKGVFSLVFLCFWHLLCWPSVSWRKKKKRKKESCSLARVIRAPQKCGHK